MLRELQRLFQSPKIFGAPRLSNHHGLVPPISMPPRQLFFANVSGSPSPRHPRQTPSASHVGPGQLDHVQPALREESSDAERIFWRFSGLVLPAGLVPVLFFSSSCRPPFLVVRPGAPPSRSHEPWPCMAFDAERTPPRSGAAFDLGTLMIGPMNPASSASSLGMNKALAHACARMPLNWPKRPLPGVFAFPFVAHTVVVRAAAYPAHPARPPATRRVTRKCRRPLLRNAWWQLPQPSAMGDVRVAPRRPSSSRRDATKRLRPSVTPALQRRPSPPRTSSVVLEAGRTRTIWVLTRMGVSRAARARPALAQPLPPKLEPRFSHPAKHVTGRADRPLSRSDVLTSEPSRRSAFVAERRERRRGRSAAPPPS